MPHTFGTPLDFNCHLHILDKLWRQRAQKAWLQTGIRSRIHCPPSAIKAKDHRSIPRVVFSGCRWISFLIGIATSMLQAFGTRQGAAPLVLC
jgi:hypothetical protein